jgi:hypothetical protein
VRTLLTALAGVLLAVNSLYAQRSPYRDWTGLQIEAQGRHARRVTVRTATGTASGTLRAVEPDRLIFGDRASKPTIVARTEICEVSISSHPVRPRTMIMSIAISGGLIAAAVLLRFKGVGTGARVFVGLGLGVGAGSTMTRPARLLYSNPEACEAAVTAR